MALSNRNIYVSKYAKQTTIKYGITSTNKNGGKQQHSKVVLLFAICKHAFNCNQKTYQSKAYTRKDHEARPNVCENNKRD